MATTSTIGLISADSHVNEPRSLWAENLPARLSDQAMRGISGTAEGGWNLIMDGRHVGKAGTSETERLEATQPSRRLAVMREEGIAGEVIFPTIGLYVWMLEDPEGGRLSCRIYNDWVQDQLERHSPRFRCAGLVPTWSVEDAVAEVQHIASLGLGAVMLPAGVDPTYNHPKWEPLWSAIEETGLPIVIHSGTGHDMIWYRGPGASVTNLLATQSMGARVASLFSTSGILERHPDLHLVMVEYTAGWMAWVMDTIDYATNTFNKYGSTAELGSAKLAGDKPAKPIVSPALKERPSTYLRRQVHTTFQDESVGINNINLTGSDVLLWGSDYPHEEGTYPNSRATVDRLSAGLSEADANRIFRDTAMRLFHFSPEVLASLP